MKYRPRNDYCLIKVTSLGLTPSGLAMPDVSVQGKEYFVVAKGPMVEDLAVGDKVLMVGSPNEDYAYLPNSKELLIIKQANIVLVYEGA